MGGTGLAQGGTDPAGMTACVSTRSCLLLAGLGWLVAAPATGQGMEDIWILLTYPTELHAKGTVNDMRDFQLLCEKPVGFVEENHGFRNAYAAAYAEIEGYRNEYRTILKDFAGSALYFDLGNPTRRHLVPYGLGDYGAARFHGEKVQGFPRPEALRCQTGAETPDPDQLILELKALVQACSEPDRDDFDLEFAKSRYRKLLRQLFDISVYAEDKSLDRTLDPKDQDRFAAEAERLKVALRDLPLYLSMVCPEPEPEEGATPTGPRGISGAVTFKGLEPRVKVISGALRFEGLPPEAKDGLYAGALTFRGLGEDPESPADPAETPKREYVNICGTAAVWNGPLELQVGTRTYRRYPQQVTWTQAVQSCQAEGGMLVTLETYDEACAVEDIITTCGGYGCWLGAYDVDQDNRFFWLSGAMMTYQNWRVGEPNNHEGAEPYVHAYPEDARWNDASNTGSAWGPLEYICEFNRR